MIPVSRSLLRAGVALAGMLIAIAATATIASAHTSLRASNPEQGSTVENLSEVRLEFDGELLEIGTELSIVDASGAQTALEPEFPSTNAVTARVDEQPAAGDAELVFRVVAADGHPIEGAVLFTVAPGAPVETTEPTEQPTEPASTPEPTASAAVTDAEVEPIAVDEPEDEPGDVPGWVWPVIALAALGGAGVAIAAARLRNRP
ncbi:copper resistance CopC family protein [Demequina activiva]|uniref:CopC domain-containing protein n=1 Tax=Demequina activiva TaxID=1582364 RepID=A0A919Q6D8_9MICO|nr:copper resistance CopC family protein [Demequina activiva]GIG55068.1 hypothetical protein Dac01nite_18200 [Demequina activiva]